MLTLVPIVHAGKDSGRMVNREQGPFGENRQVLVRYDRSDFDDVVLVRVEAGHFEIDPDEVVFLFEEFHVTIVSAELSLQRAAAKDVQMCVKNHLAAGTLHVHRYPIARQASFCRKALGGQKEVTDEGGIARCEVVERRDVLAGHDERMKRRLWMHVLERDYTIILV